MDLSELIHRKGKIVSVNFADLVQARNKLTAMRKKPTRTDSPWLKFVSPCCGHHPEAHDGKGCIRCVLNPCRVTDTRAWILADRT